MPRFKALRASKTAFTSIIRSKCKRSCRICPIYMIIGFVVSNMIFDDT